ncbi:ABC transporter ATP-binding protein [Ramlibacter sp. USB13]|uniref:ABC transporter ATP-binding protein n=1 Tax=Ramlibacter cellulosilyticus TaxID=2764187 RepID=A0A923MNR2_9BURK|nr:ABC transporter ATP-binding protein [Ramlibacter cellulosilyticus]MBC5781799.1 ABC transporter ATP-binding protein [Ramlibacter cellulosilyticus]
MEDTPVVRLRGIRKSFNVGEPNETEVLHGVDLVVRRGEFVAVMGPSGSGKSTLLNIVGLLDRPTAGSLEITGRETTGLDEAELTRLRGHTIGFVFQYHHLINAFSAVENVMMPMLGAGGVGREDMARRASDLIARVGLAPWADQPAGRLSGGQQQRVAVARGLAMEPALLLADEPTGNLDTKSADVVFELLRTVSREQGTSVLFVTHNPELARRCDRIVQVVDGRIAPEAPHPSAR